MTMKKIRFLKLSPKVPKELIYSFIFCLLFYLIESWLLKFNYDQFEKLNTKEFRIPLMANLMLSTITFLFFVVGIWLTLLSKKLWKICFYIFICVSLIVEYSCKLSLNHFTTIYEWSIVGQTNEDQKKDLLYLFLNPQSLFMIAFSIAFIKVFSVNKNQKYLNTIKFSYFSLMLFFYSLSYSYTSNMYITISACAFIRSGIAFPCYVFKTEKYHKSPRKRIKYASKPQKTNQNIVFILDESVRGDHNNFYGYERLVTSKILLEMKKQNKLINWKECVSGATASFGSNLLLLTGLQNEYLPDTEMNTLMMPTLFQYAKAMGYKTYCLDGQMQDYWNGKKDDLNYIDSRLGIDSFIYRGNYYIDSLIAIKIKEIIKDTTSLHFIWVNKMGVHTAYERNYPKESEQWKPTKGYTRPTGDKNTDALNRQMLINNYDNALSFNSRVFWNSLTNKNGNLDEKTVFIYTSDHGQTLSDKGEFWPHNSNSSKEASVPLWIINKPKQLQIDTNFLPHHSNILPTLLDLMGFPDTERTFMYDKSLFKGTVKDNRPRQSWHGHLYRKTPGSGRVPFD